MLRAICNPIRPLMTQNKPAPALLRAAIYARFSTDMQNAMSAEDQVRLAEQKATAEGWEVSDVFTDLAISGTSDRRPGLQAMVAAIKAGEVDVVLAEALDRLSRNQADIATLYQRITFAGARVFTLSEGWVNELHIGLLGTMNAIQIKELGNKIRRGQKGSVKRGRVPGGLSYGYEPDPVLRPDGTVERGRRRINEAEAAIVRRIFREYLAGDSPGTITNRLNREGVPAPRGKLWRPTTLIGTRGRQNGILYNPAYSGRIVYNRVKMHVDPESRKRISRVNSESELETCDAPELRIIAEADWQAVQERRKQIAGVPIARLRRPKHLLSGLVKCAECGGSYVIIDRGRWGCTVHREGGPCSNGRRISAAVLEQRVMRGLKEKLMSPDIVAAIVKEYHEERAHIANGADRRRSKLQARIGKARDEIARLVDAIAIGSTDSPSIRAGIQQREAEIRRTEAELAEIDAASTIVLHPNIVEAYRRRINELCTTVATGQDARAYFHPIRNLIARITVQDDITQPDKAAVQVHGSLDEVVALATEQNRGLKVVAEEGLEPPTRGL